MFFEEGPRVVPPSAMAGVHLRLCAVSIEKRSGESDLSKALRAACDHLKQSAPDWERDEDGLKLAPKNYDPAVYCQLVERLCAEVLDSSQSGEHLVERVLRSLIDCARSEAAGRIERAWRCFASASFATGAALGECGANPDAIAKEVRSATARNAANVRHANNGNKATVHAMWQGQRVTMTNDAFAKLAESKGLCTYGTALKWQTQWRQADRNK